jgi:eukaryotic-like serine/threonine-protein kinase
MESSPLSSPMIEAISAEQFLKHLAGSGLMTEAEINAAMQPLTAAQRQDGRLIAQHLVKQGKLTPYQAQVISQGRIKGLVLGNYVILEKIGQGGMGMVFKAHHRRMDRTVALKVLPPNVTKLSNAVKRFQREVQAAARLTHPNIVAAYDADEANGVHFLVMEFVEGSDLSDLVKKQGPLKPAQAVECMLQAAAGLAHAHAAGIVHRDIKPSNLLIGKAQGSQSLGFLKILDMGLARIDAGTTPKAGNDELTETGNIFGTCDYMAPEQAKNAKLADQRADIYSLGCTLYYLLTGKTMYSADTSLAKLLAHQQDPIPPLTNVPPSLQAVYQQMVAKKVEERYQSMAEVMAALEECQGELPGVTDSPRKRTGVKAPPAGLSATSSEITLGEGQRATRLLKPRNPARRSRATVLLAGVALVAIGGIAGLLAFNPPLRAKLLSQFMPGTSLAAVSTNTGTEPTNLAIKSSDSTVKPSDLSTRPAETRPVEKLPPTKPIEKLPETKLTILPLATPTASTTLQAPVGTAKSETDGQVTAVAFSHTGLLATATRGAGLKVWDTAKLEAPFRFFNGGFESLTFSPKGNILAAGEQGGSIRHFDMEKGAERAPLEGPRTPVYAMAFPSATKLVVAQYSNGPNLYIWDVLPKKSTGQQGPLKDATGLPHMALSADGKLLAWASKANTLRVVKVSDGTEVNTLKGHTTPIRSVAISPSGFQVSAGAEDGSIRVWETASGKETAVFKGSSKSATIALAFSHDGNRLASGSWDAAAHVWDIPMQRERAVCKGHRNGVTAIAFSHDDRMLATGSRDATVKLWELPPPGK